MTRGLSDIINLDVQLIQDESFRQAYKRKLDMDGSDWEIKRVRRA